MGSPNVAVVVLDTLRRDLFSRYFEWVPGLRFENAYSTSHWTVPAHASLLTGMYPSEVGIHGKSMNFDCPDQSIVETLHDVGYTTRMWTANMQIHTWDGWDRGFDQFLGRFELHPSADESVDWREFIEQLNATGVQKYIFALWYILNRPGRTIPSLQYGLELFRQKTNNLGGKWTLERLQETNFGNSEFLLLNLMEAHTPHKPPKPFRTFDERIDFKIGDAFAGTIESPDRNRRAYDDSCAYLSNIYREIFPKLQKHFDYIFTLSDHGELLGEHGMWNHGYGLYPELTHVPFVLTGARCDDAVREDVVSLLDVPQTIASLTGVDFESRGRDILNDTDPVDRLVEYHGFLPWHREQFEDKGVGELYDKYNEPLNGVITANNKYIYHTHDKGLVAREGTITETHRVRLDTLRSDLSIRDTESEFQTLSTEVKERLKDLGYA